MSINSIESYTFGPTSPLVIFIKGYQNTLHYFIDHMAVNTPNCHILNICDKEQFLNELQALGPYMDMAAYVITFNNVGLNLLYGGQNYWDTKPVQIYNIMVDMPIWYRDILEAGPKRMRIITVDKNHLQFLQKYYPAYSAAFLPHGGALSPLASTPYEDRTIDILYVGSRQPLTNPEANLAFFPDQGEEFLQTAYNLLLKYPFLTPEQFVELYCDEVDFPMNRNDYLECIHAVYYYILRNVRAYYQEEVLSSLAKSHFHVTVYGDHWYPLAQKHPEYIHAHERTTPAKCIELICNSKIVLNVQPWFKDGAHERIYNAMLNEAVCVSDTSEYLKRHFTDGENIIFYELTQMDALVTKTGDILQNPGYAKQIIRKQKQTVLHSTWYDRLNNILEQKFTEGDDYI